MRKLLRERLAVLITIAMVVTGIPMPTYAGTVSLQAAQQYQLGTWVYSTSDEVNYTFTPEESGEYVVWLLNQDADAVESGRLEITGNDDYISRYVYFDTFDVDVVELSLEKGNTYTMEYESESSTDKNEMGFLIKKTTQSNIVMDQKQSITGEEFGYNSFQCSVAESGLYAVNFEFLAEKSDFIEISASSKGISTKTDEWKDCLYISLNEGEPLDVRIFSKNAGNISVEVQKINIVEMTGSTMTNLSYDPNAAKTLYHVALDENSMYDIVSTGTGSGKAELHLLESDFGTRQSNYAYDDSWNMAMSCRIGAESDEEEDETGENNRDGKIDYYILFNGDQAAQNLTLSVNKVSADKEIVADTPLTETIDTIAPRYYSFTPATAGIYSIGGTFEGFMDVTIYDDQWNYKDHSYISSGSQMIFEAKEGQTLYIKMRCEETQADPVQTGNISVEVQKINIVEMTGSTMTNLSYDPNAAKTLYHVALDENSMYDIVSTGNGSGQAGLQLLESDYLLRQLDYAYDSWNMAMSRCIGAESDEEEDENETGENNRDGKIDYYILFNGDQAAQNLTLSVNKVSVHKEIVADTPLTETIDTIAPRYYSFTPATAGKYSIGGTFEGFVTIYDDQWNYKDDSYISSVSEMTFEAKEGQTLYIRMWCEETQADPGQILLEKSNWDYEIADGVLTISGSGRLSGDWGMFYRIDPSIHKIVIGEGITSVGSGIFVWLDQVTEVSLPSTLTSIGKSAFSRLDLKEIAIPDAVTSIGYGAFRFNDNLEKVTIGKGVTTIGGDAFADDSKLKSITVHSDNQTYKSKDNVLFTKDEKRLVMYPAGLESSSYIVPETVTSIAYAAFWGNMNIKTVAIPTSVQSIEEAAFSGTGLTSVAIPESVTTISGRSFIGCQNLETVTIPVSVTAVKPYAFLGNDKLTTVYYNGTDAQWNSIRIEEGNGELTDAKRLQNIAEPEGNPSQNPGGNSTQNSGGNVTQNPGGNPSQNSGTTVTQNPGGNTTQNSSANTSTSKSKTKSKQKLKVKSGTKVNYTKKQLKKAKKKFTIKLSGAKGKVTYTSNKKKYVTVSSKGVVTVKKGTPKGTYKITVKAAGNSKYKAASATITIKVK